MSRHRHLVLYLHHLKTEFMRKSRSNVPSSGSTANKPELSVMQRPIVCTQIINYNLSDSKRETFKRNKRGNIGERRDLLLPCCRHLLWSDCWDFLLLSAAWHGTILACGLWWRPARRWIASTTAHLVNQISSLRCFVKYFLIYFIYLFNQVWVLAHLHLRQLAVQLFSEGKKKHVRQGLSRDV